MTNESKWVTAISGLLAALMPLLVLYGVLTAEEAKLWTALILAIVAAVSTIVAGSLARNYNDNATAIQVAILEANAR